MNFRWVFPRTKSPLWSGPMVAPITAPPYTKHPDLRTIGGLIKNLQEAVYRLDEARVPYEAEDAIRSVLFYVDRINNELKRKKEKSGE